MGRGTAHPPVRRRVHAPGHVRVQPSFPRAATTDQPKVFCLPVKSGALCHRRVPRKHVQTGRRHRCVRCQSHANIGEKNDGRPGAERHPVPHRILAKRVLPHCPACQRAGGRDLPMLKNQLVRVERAEIA